MGKGLDIEPTGEYIAYAAGTGVLVFIDIVAHLVLRLLQEEESSSVLDVESFCDKIDLAKFKFTLFTSFASEDEAIGMKMIETLLAQCQKYKAPKLFRHVARISGTPSGK